MGVWRNFWEQLFSTKERIGAGAESIVIDIPADIYYLELALYTASSLIGNAISRSEIKCFEKGKSVKNKDYYKLNVSPNRNETSSVFWHKVINNVIRKNKALVVEDKDFLYCADSYSVELERPLYGDIYSGVTVGNYQFNKTFKQNNTYLFQLDNMDLNRILNGMYEQYSKILGAAATKFNQSHAQKYILHIDGVKAEDKEFEKEFNEIIQEQLKVYIKSDSAVYPEYDGYKFTADESADGSVSSQDFTALKKDLFETVAGALHIPNSMMNGNINNMKDIVALFLSFGVDPFADMITESLNKGAGIDQYIAGNYYAVDTSYNNHRDIFDLASAVNYLISSGTYCIDELREKLGEAPLNTEWSRKHFITKNFEEIEKFLNPAEGGEK